MAAPETLNTQAELESAISAEKLRQLLPGAGKKEADAARVLLALQSGTGAVFGPIAKALKTISIDEWWDAPTTSARDKAEVKRLGLSASIHYAHFYGLKADEMPEAVIAEMERVERRAMEIGDGYSTLGANTNPESATQHEFHYGNGPGRSPEGSQRWRWRNY